MVSMLLEERPAGRKRTRRKQDIPSRPRRTPAALICLLQDRQTHRARAAMSRWQARGMVDQPGLAKRIGLKPGYRHRPDRDCWAAWMIGQGLPVCRCGRRPPPLPVPVGWRGRRGYTGSFFCSILLLTARGKSRLITGAPPEVPTPTKTRSRRRKVRVTVTPATHGLVCRLSACQS